MSATPTPLILVFKINPEWAAKIAEETDDATILKNTNLAIDESLLITKKLLEGSMNENKILKALLTEAECAHKELDHGLDVASELIEALGNLNEEFKKENIHLRTQSNKMRALYISAVKENEQLKKDMREVDDALLKGFTKMDAAIDDATECLAAAKLDLSSDEEEERRQDEKEKRKDEWYKNNPANVKKEEYEESWGTKEMKAQWKDDFGREMTEEDYHIELEYENLKAMGR